MHIFYKLYNYGVATAGDTDLVRLNCLIHDKESVRLSDIVTVIISKTDNFNILKDKLKEKSFLLRKTFQEGIVISKKDPNFIPQANEDLIKTYNDDGLDGSWKRVNDPTELIVNHLPKALRDEYTYFVASVDHSRVEL
ncbi:5184_t:CDS:2 [Ambispora leptoticha]|uniref:5184_t:CDS:1 n=1 Tax=Ambispora leptoticha TaxID=144679 RepID=A0A9N8WIT6_9GLOM|nr:5184_t:CDS:2 [Ambispora leptoticha]